MRTKHCASFGKGFVVKSYLDSDSAGQVILGAVHCVPSIVFGSDGEQRVNGAGVPLREVHVTVLDRDALRPRPELVRVPCAGDPGVVAAPIWFGGMHINTYSPDGGGVGASFAAESFTQEPSPSSGSGRGSRSSSGRAAVGAVNGSE